MNIGENIRRIREDKGVSQTELSERVHVTSSMICQIERGTKSVSMQLGQEIAGVLGVPVMALYEKTDTAS